MIVKNLVEAKASYSPFYLGTMSDNNYDDLLALNLDEAMGSNRDSVLQEDYASGEEINFHQGILQSNRDLLTESQLVHIMNHPSHDEVPVGC